MVLERSTVGFIFILLLNVYSTVCLNVQLESFLKSLRSIAGASTALSVLITDLRTSDKRD